MKEVENFRKELEKLISLQFDQAKRIFRIEEKLGISKKKPLKVEEKKEVKKKKLDKNAPPCSSCGNIMTKSGACYTCSFCGEAGGCG